MIKKLNELVLPMQRRIEVLFYLMVAFALLGPSVGIAITPDFKLTFFRVAFLLLAGVLIIRLVTHKKIETSDLHPVRWYFAFFGFWFVYSIISLTWVADMKMGIRYTVFLGMMLPLALSFPYFIKTEKVYWRILKILFGVFAVIAIYPVFESITTIHLPSSRHFEDVGNVSVTSFFRNQNDLATAMTILIPFLITALYILNIKIKYKVIVYGVLVFALFSLFATGSRSNTSFVLPLILLTTIASVPFTVKRKQITLKNIGISIVLTGLAIVLVSGISMVALSETAKQRINEKIGSTGDFIDDVRNAASNQDENYENKSGKSATERTELIFSGFEFLQKSHYMGVGAGNTEAWMETKGFRVVNIHNWWMEILVNYGVIVFVLYMALYLWMIWRLWKIASHKSNQVVSQALRFGALATFISLIGFFIGGMTPSTAIHYTPMWCLYGIGLAVIVLGEKQLKQKENLSAVKNA
ncbi:O-antigen ligase family protein [Hazenella sp. IB182357]|uniref:O-antigen ligase family protein n=1 Tax=Polycladospora coralii TaxID=2771432 RepID=A0A926RX45_9BACL|nr:O-antigen ligase family protein [Polycladospora coralii]MBD1372181.1 O-antigen ligase family protein [Polycladospora coralii]